MNITLIPPSAPFSPEQRAWLNGFLAGWIGLNPQAGSTTAIDANGSAERVEPIVEAPSKPEFEPWHDPSLAIDRRLQLADGQPMARRLMAAMAQLDCGSCGYDCRTYSEAIARGEETRLSLCSPGGSTTARVLKRLLREQTPGDRQSSHITEKTNGQTNDERGWTRENPYTARIIRAVNLNRPGSEKATYHVELELGRHGPTYRVGDSLGLYPENCPTLVDEVIEALGAQGDEPVTLASWSATTLRAALISHSGLSEVTDGLLERLADAATDLDEARQLRELLDDDLPIAGSDVLDVLRRFPSARINASDFINALAPIQPRLYSIASSPNRHQGQVHLTVRRVCYEFGGRSRKGVASTMLADRVSPGSLVRVFVQKAHGFTLPDDPETPILMIGPGTGIAPFRAFLHERDAVGARGKSWLVFGDQRRGTDFLYEDELTDFLQRGVLTRLDTAFSRDQDHKLYVQHRLIELGAEVVRWLQDGARIYVCGDAKRMAADVDQALRDVVRRHGGMSADESGAYLASLAASGRYLKDIY
jgi:sulfite reductase (NADPH) flavoprotein alpha-component